MREFGFGWRWTVRWEGEDVLGFMDGSLGCWDEGIGLAGLCSFALGADRSFVSQISQNGRH